MLRDFNFRFPHADPSRYRRGAVGPITDLLAHVVLPNEGPAYYLYITHMLVTNADLVVGTVVEFLDDANNIIYHGYAARTGGFSLSFPTPLQVPENSALRVRCLAVVPAGIRVSIVGFSGVGYSLRS
jgi:hypothetical protein